MAKVNFELRENPSNAIFILVVLIVSGMALSGLAFAALAFIVPAFRDILYNGMPQTPAFMRAMVAVNMPVMFLLPALYVAGRYHPGEFGRTTKIDRSPLLQIVLWTIVVLVVSQPALNLVGEWNKQFALPDAFGGLMDWMKQSEAEAERLSNTMVETNSVWALIANLVVMAILPGFCEEFLFRGVVQPIFVDWFGRKHLAVWATAFVFSFIHFQFFGFIPRLLLGAMLGYLVLYSGSLWSSILMHTANNAFIVVFTYLQFNGLSSYPIDKIGVGETAWMGVCSLFITVSIYFVIKKISNRTLV